MVEETKIACLNSSDELNEAPEFQIQWRVYQRLVSSCHNQTKMVLVEIHTNIVHIVH